MKAKLIFILIAGGLFGTGLAVSGMTDPGRVIGFLDVFGKWDPALLVVMCGAVAVYGIGMFVLRRRAGVSLRVSHKLPATKSSPIDLQLVIGAAIFGVGWGLSGFCPGPSLANLGALRIQAFVFVPLMAVGMFLAQRLCRSDNQQ